MAVNERVTAVGIFQDVTHAEMAVEDLRRAGFAPQQIGLISPDGAAQVEPPAVEPGTHAGSGAAAGAALGGAVGAGLGFMASAAALPVAGPVVLGGVLAATL